MGTFHKNFVGNNNHAVTANPNSGGTSYADISARDADSTFNTAAENVNKIVRVESPLSFYILTAVTPAWEGFGASAFDTFTELTDTPGTITANQLVLGNPGGTALIFSEAVPSLQVTGTFKDSSGDVGTSGQILSSTVTGTNWITSSAGDVTKVGTPVDNQVGVWTGDGTLEGTTGLTFTGSLLSISGRTRSANGTELLPAHSFTNDTASGMRLSATNILNFSARGFDVLQLTAEAVSTNFLTVEATASNTTDGVKVTAAATGSNVVLTMASKGTGEFRINAGGSDGNVAIGRTGSTTAIKSDTVTVVDKNLTIGNVTTPTDVTADGGGLTLKGATDKTISWINSTDRWTFNQGIELLAGGNFVAKGTGTGQITTTSGITLSIQPISSGDGEIKFLTSAGADALTIKSTDLGNKSIIASGSNNFIIQGGGVTTLAGATVDLSATTTVSIDTDGPDTVPILELENTGTNSGEKKHFLGSRTPVGNVTGTPGDEYSRTSTTTSTIYIHKGATVNNTDWVDVGIASDVTKVGTPLNNQVGIWTGDGTIEGSASLTFDGTELITVNLQATGTLKDSSGDVGTSGQILSSTVTGTNWIAAGIGDVVKVGTPVNNQIAVWTGDGTLEGESGLTYNANALDLSGTFNTSENISIPNSKTVRFNGLSDANWAIGRNAVIDTGGLVTSNSLQVITGDSAGEGFQILSVASLTPIFEINGATKVGAYNGGNFGFGLGATPATVAVDIVGDLKTTGTIEAGDNISLPTTKNIRFNGVSDPDWKMGRNTVPDSGGLVTGNALQILTGDAATEGFQILSSIDNTPIFEIRGDTKFVAFNGGNVGIGTGSTPATAKLQIVSSGTFGAPSGFASDFTFAGSGNSGMTIFSGSGGTGHIVFGDPGGSDVGRLQYNHGLDAMFIVLAGTNALTAKLSNKHIGIGVDLPDTRLHVLSTDPDTTAVITTESTGTNPGESATFVGNRDPSGNITGAGGAEYKRDSGATSGTYESREITTGTGWFKRAINPTNIIEINTSAEFEALATAGVITVSAGNNLTIVMNFTVVTSTRFVVEAGAALDITGRRTAGAGIAYTGTATLFTGTLATIQLSDSLTITAVSTGTLISMAGGLMDFEGVVLNDWDNLGTFTGGIFLMRFVNMISCTTGFTLTNFSLISVFNATHLGIPMTTSLFTVTTNNPNATGVFDAILATLSATGSVLDFDTRMNNGIQINVRSVDPTFGVMFRPSTVADATINSIANAPIAAGTITAQATNGAGGTTHSSTTTYFEDEEVVITGTTSYNGTFQIFNVVAGVSFDTVTTFVADDATGTVNTSRIEMTLAGGHGVTTGMNIKVNETDSYNGFYTVLNVVSDVITLNQVVGTPITDTGTINRNLSVDQTDSRVNAFNNLRIENSGARAFGEVNANTQITTITDGTYAVINMSLMVNNGISSRFKLINTITGIWEYTATEPFNGRLGAITNFLKTGSTQDYRIVFTIDGVIPTFATEPYQPAEMTTTKKSQTIENFVTMTKGQTFQLLVAGDGTANTCTFTDVTITAIG